MQQRATNLEMQKWIVRHHGFVVESHWIDWHKQQLSARAELARPAECPSEHHIAIIKAFRYFGLL